MNSLERKSAWKGKVEERLWLWDAVITNISGSVLLCTETTLPPDRFTMGLPLNFLLILDHRLTLPVIFLLACFSFTQVSAINYQQKSNERRKNNTHLYFMEYLLL